MWFKRSKKNQDITNQIESGSELFSAKAANKVAKLSSMQLSLNAAIKTKEVLKNINESIKEQASLGKLQARYLLLVPDYVDELVRQIPNTRKEVQEIFPTRLEDLAATQDYIKVQLGLAGYSVTIRSLNLQVQRVQGDTGTFFMGHEIFVTW